MATPSQILRDELKPGSKEAHSWRGTEEFSIPLPPSPLAAKILLVQKKVHRDLTTTPDALRAHSDLLYLVMRDIVVTATRIAIQSGGLRWKKLTGGLYLPHEGWEPWPGPLSIVKHFPLEDEFHIILEGEWEMDVLVLPRAEIVRLGRNQLIDDV